jgi:hypothetical protein
MLPKSPLAYRIIVTVSAFSVLRYYTAVAGFRACGQSWSAVLPRAAALWPAVPMGADYDDIVVVLREIQRKRSDQ